MKVKPNSRTRVLQFALQEDTAIRTINNAIEAYHRGDRSPLVVELVTQTVAVGDAEKRRHENHD